MLKRTNSVNGTNAVLSLCYKALCFWQNIFKLYTQWQIFQEKPVATNSFPNVMTFKQKLPLNKFIFDPKFSHFYSERLNIKEKQATNYSSWSTADLLPDRKGVCMRLHNGRWVIFREQEPGCVSICNMSTQSVSMKGRAPGARLTLSTFIFIAAGIWA